MALCGFEDDWFCLVMFEDDGGLSKDLLLSVAVLWGGSVLVFLEEWDSLRELMVGLR